MTLNHTHGDFRVIDGGSVVGIKPISDAGREWWDEHVQSHEGWQETNGFVWCDRRAARAIADGFEAGGLTARNIDNEWRCCACGAVTEKAGRRYLCACDRANGLRRA